MFDRRFRRCAVSQDLLPKYILCPVFESQREPVVLDCIQVGSPFPRDATRQRGFAEPWLRMRLIVCCFLTLSARIYILGEAAVTAISQLLVDCGVEYGTVVTEDADTEQTIDDGPFLIAIRLRKEPFQ